MAIETAILGYLGWKPLSGYDLKKLFADSPFFHWSGNSNQIYRALVKLHGKQLVDVEVTHQDGAPSRKTYRLTEAGRQALRDGVLAEPEPPQVRRAFLVQLAWADLLDDGELAALVAAYRAEVEAELLMLREKVRRGVAEPARSPRERTLWRLLASGQERLYEAELAWVDDIRAALPAAGEGAP